MKLFKRVIIPMILSFTILLQTGCWDQKIYEKIGFILQLGIELDRDNKYIYSVSLPVVSPESNEKTEVISTTTTLMRDGRNRIRRIAGKEVEGSPKGLMNTSLSYKDKPRPSIYVNSLLDNASKNSFAPETRLSDFEILAHSGTIDPISPLISYNEKEIQVIGSALFNGDKMVGKINASDTGLLLGLMKKRKSINYLYKGTYSGKKQISVKNGVAISMKTNHRIIKVNVEQSVPTIDVELDFKGSVSEYPGELNLSNPEDKKKLETAVSESLKKDFKMLLGKLSQVDSDPVGFGEIVRVKHNKYWKSGKWKDSYKTAVFNIDVKVEFETYGAISQS